MKGLVTSVEGMIRTHGETTPWGMGNYRGNKGNGGDPRVRNLKLHIFEGDDTRWEGTLPITINRLTEEERLIALAWY